MYAAIDLGSNSFHLLIARAHSHGIEQYDRFSEKVQLAEGLVETGKLSTEAMERGWQNLIEIRDHLSWYDISAVRAVGTYALRAAKNAPDFLRKAEKLLGYPIEVLDGEEEARHIYNGVQFAEGLVSDALVIDIGGGSTEFALGKGYEIERLFSEEMGCVTLRDTFFDSQAILRRDFDEASEDVRQWIQLPASKLDAHTWNQVWGSSGTMKAVARMLNGLHGCGFLINRAQLRSLMEDILRRRRYSALSYPFLNDDRKSVILPGMIIIAELMDELSIETLHVSQASLREGLVWDMAL